MAYSAVERFNKVIFSLTRGSLFIWVGGLRCFYAIQMQDNYPPWLAEAGIKSLPDIQIYFPENQNIASPDLNFAKCQVNF